ncbi:uncharacterized protein Z518_07580 [Rhinocladiella mackenziei CBS 650.93]|uniref:Uncharacterized protein n=1 Tax=Rhinocladiella mackenziei CBS 650.93 TaxID=1442369 RepID=A0A0D2FPF3_9EURO|nr:uncharacterized protein Z518_07580 [Rhinocladiella mackenziei CBS 650.93]KIX04027.1 hypothetical protein Z518_07580 [Rhinocladiella mackenziei CBS 650.93]
MLHILRAYEQAFDVHFLMYCHFRDLKTQNRLPDPRFVLAAINCVRSARTKSHVVVTKSTDLEIWGKFDPQLSDLSSEDFQEDHEDTAYWGANAMILSRPDLANEHGIVPRRFHDILPKKRGRTPL